MIGIQIYATPSSVYFAVVKEDETPKLVEVFIDVKGNSGGLSSTSTALPNRLTLISTDKQLILDYITSVGAVYDTDVEVPV
jgi:hypothetical protein